MMDVAVPQMEAVKALWSGRSVGKALLVLGLAACMYQAWKRWRTRKQLGKLRGKVVLITGASSGVGEALARVFHSSGAKVILASRNVQQLERIKFQLDNKHVEKLSSVPERYSPKVLRLDLSDPSSLPAKCQEAIQMFGRIDILINNAGVSMRGAVSDTDLSVDRKVMEVNFFGTVALTKGILPSMLEQGGGHVVVISSLQGKMGLPYRSSYSASKHALQGYFDSLRIELSSRGVLVTMVCPGYIATQLSVNALTGDGGQHGVVDATTAKGMDPHDAAKVILHAVASGKREVIIAKPLHHMAVYMNVLCPRLLDWVLKRRSKIT